MNVRVRKLNRLKRSARDGWAEVNALKQTVRIQKRIFIGTVIAFAIAAVLNIVFTDSSEYELNLPKPNLVVIAWTGNGEHWYKAYMDEQFEFRNAETGEKIGQVIKWKYSEWTIE